MDVLENEFGVKDSYLDLVQKDFYLLALNLIEYVNNELWVHFRNGNLISIMNNWALFLLVLIIWIKKSLIYSFQPKKFAKIWI